MNEVYIIQKGGAYGVLKVMGRTVSYDLYLTGGYHSEREFTSEESARRFYERSVQIAKRFEGIPFWINFLSR